MRARGRRVLVACVLGALALAGGVLAWRETAGTPGSRPADPQARAPDARPSVTWATRDAGAFPELERAASGVARAVREAVSGPLVVRGRVIDQGHAPVPRARCDLEGRIVDAAGEHPWSCAFDWSEEDGTFELQCDREARDVVLVVSSRGHRTARVALAAAGGDPTVMLVAQPPLLGTVVWPDGRAVNGARIVADDGELPRAASFKVTSDELGRFSIDGLGDGPVTVQARAAREWSGTPEQPTRADGIADERCEVAIAAPMRLARPFGDVRLVLHADLELTGRVVDEHGEPWTAFRVVALPHRAGSDLPLTSEQQRKSFTSEDGAFAMRELHAGAWSVIAVCGPKESAAKVVVLGPAVGPAFVELVCPRGATLRGRVVDAGGAPVRDATVSVFARDERAGKLRTAQHNVAESDADGRFAFDGIEPVPNTLDVVAKHRHRRSEIVTVALREGAPNVPLELRLHPTGTLRVRALGPGGAAVRASVAWIDTHAVEPAVSAADERGGAEELVLRARSGSLVADQEDGERLTLPVGTYFVRAYEAQWRSATRRVTLTADEELALDLTLAEGVELVVETSQAFEDLRPSFELFGEGGAPMGRLLVGGLPRRDLQAANPPGVHGFRAQRGIADGKRAAGQRRTTALLPGAYRLHVATEDGRRIEREVVVPVEPEGGVVRVELDTDR